MKIYIAILISLLAFPAFPKNKVDSLKRVISYTSKKDHNYIKNHVDLADAMYEETDTLDLQLIQKISDVSNQLEDDKGTAESYRLRGKYYTSKENKGKAQTQYLLAAEKYAALKDSASASRMYLEVARFYIRPSNDTALVYLDKAKQFIPLRQNTLLNGEYYKELGNYHYGKNELMLSIDAYRISLDFYKKSKDTEGIAYQHYLMAYVLYDVSEYDSAVYHLRNALSMYETLQDTVKIILMLNDLGLSNMNMGRLKESVEQFLRGIRLSDAIAYYRYIGPLYLNIGLVNYANENLELALEYFQKSIEGYDKNDQHNRTIYPLNAMGLTYVKQKKYEKALQSYSEALELAQIRQDSMILGFVHRSIGETYLALKKMDEAYEYLMKSNAYLKNYSPHEQANTYGAIAKYYLENKKYDTSILYADKAYMMGKEIKALASMRQFSLFLSQAHEGMGNIRQALDYRKLYQELSDSLLSEEKSKHINQLQMDYDYEKRQQMLQFEHEKKELASQAEIHKQKIIRNFSIIMVLLIAVFSYFQVRNQRRTVQAYKMLEKQNKIINQQKEELQSIIDQLETKQKELYEANASKDKFFSIMAHDIKSPFSSIIGFSELLVDDYEEYKDHERKNILREIQKSSKSVLELLQNLLEWSRLQTGRIKYKPGLFSMDTVIEKNVDLLYLSTKNKNIQIHVSNTREDNKVNADVNMVSTVLRNLLSNAVKFSRQDGTIEIFTKVVDGNYLSITVKDNGVGIKEEDLSKLFKIDVKFSTFGTNNEKGTGLGLILCKEFVELNGGEISFESTYDKGSSFTFTLPLKHSEVLIS